MSVGHLCVGLLLLGVTGLEVAKPHHPSAHHHASAHAGTHHSLASAHNHHSHAHAQHHQSSTSSHAAHHHHAVSTTHRRHLFGKSSAKHSKSGLRGLRRHPRVQKAQHDGVT